MLKRGEPTLRLGRQPAPDDRSKRFWLRGAINDSPAFAFPFDRGRARHGPTWRGLTLLVLNSTNTKHSGMCESHTPCRVQTQLPESFAGGGAL